MSNMTATTCATVGELIDILRKLDPVTRILCSGPDSGGYDCTLNGVLKVSPPPPLLSANYRYIKGPGYVDVTEPDPEDKQSTFSGPYYQEDNAFYHSQPFIIFEGVSNAKGQTVWEEQQNFNCGRGIHSFIEDGGGLIHMKTCYRCGVPNPIYNPKGSRSGTTACDLRRKVLLR